MSEQQTQDNRNLILDSNCNIRDLKTFDAIAGEGHEIAGLHFYCMLDHLSYLRFGNS